MSSTAMQVVPQQAQAPTPTSSFPVTSPAVSQRQYQQPQPSQGRDPYYDQQSTQFTSPSQSSRRPSQGPSGNGTSTGNASTPLQPQYYYGANIQNSRRQQPTFSTHVSPPTSATATSPVSPPPRREGQEQFGGPPIPPPPRTSSNQRGLNVIAPPAVAPALETNSASRKTGRLTDDRPTSSRAVDTGDGRERGDRERDYGGDYTSGSERERAKDDSATAAAAAARSRRRGPQSPEGPKRSGSTKQVRAQQSPSNVQSRSAAAVRTVNSASGTGLAREGSTVINRVVVTDPRVDIDRELERLAEAQPAPIGADVTPVTGLGLVGSEGVEDGARGGGKARQDYSASASRRKETRFGEYVLGQTLGEGEFGKVKLGWKKDGSVQVAIKLIRRETLGSNPSRLPKIYREISILRELSHPNIVRLHEMVETDRHIGIILEYASGGELFDYILNHRYLKDNAARRLFAQLVSGVGYLHKKGIVHRDLKLENLLLDRNRNIIITDFGFANTFDATDELGDEIEYNLANRDFVKKLDLERVRDNGTRRGDLMQTSCGSPCYAAPELVVSDSLYTGRKVDVWSCGVILYAMLAGYLPFDDDPANPEGDNINLLYKYIVSTPLTFPEYVTPHARDLLRRILVPDPRKRADLFEVARHSWLSEYAHVVAHVTSSTTTVGDIANATVTAGMNLTYTTQTLVFSKNTHCGSSVANMALTKSTEDHPDAPLLARSASVREPAKPHPANMSPVGGLNHQQGKIDLDQQGEKPKPQRDAKRRTVQVEYVAPQSQTIRGEPRPSPSTAGSPQVADVGVSRTRTRAGSQGPVDAPRQIMASESQTGVQSLPTDPPGLHDSRPVQTYEATIAQGKGHQRPSSSHQGMPPPARPGREVPRSVSDSIDAFGSSQPSVPRPNTGGSMSSTGNGRFEMRLPSRGSYGQPVAPTVATTNAQGKLAQPQTSKQYVISNPIPQQEMKASIGQPSTQQMSPTYDQRPPPPLQNQPQRGHKRSNTVGGIGEKIFGRSNSIFGGRPQQDAKVQGQQKPEKKYPPVSMTNATVPDAPRRSTESRRSISFGFGRKTSDL
ncbi:MAG: hypothetical protein M1830_002704, partial [Pleopsidium flavum]